MSAVPPAPLPPLVEPGPAGESPPAGAWLAMEGHEPWVLQSMNHVGRSAENEIRLAGEKVSRRHALVHTPDGRVYWLADAGSSNGTYLNGTRITEAHCLHDGDRVGVGPWTLVFHQPGGPARARPDYSLTVASVPFRDPRPVTAWVLVVELGARTGAPDAGVPDASARALGAAVDAARQVVERSGGVVHRYLGAGFLASWEHSPTAPVAVGVALRELRQVSTRGRIMVRLAIHWGPVQAESIVEGRAPRIGGPGVSFALRMAKLGGTFDAPVLVSEPVAELLREQTAVRPLGRHAVGGFPGEFEFYGAEERARS